MPNLTQSNTKLMLVFPGLTLHELMEDYWKNIAVEGQEVLKIFSIYVVSGLLRALDVMHGKGWTHSDLHGRNLDWIPVS